MKKASIAIILLLTLVSFASCSTSEMHAFQGVWEGPSTDNEAIRLTISDSTCDMAVIDENGEVSYSAQWDIVLFEDNQYCLTNEKGLPIFTIAISDSNKDLLILAPNSTEYFHEGIPLAYKRVK